MIARTGFGNSDLIVTFTNWRRLADAGDVGQSRHNVAAVIDGDDLHFVSRSAGAEAANAHHADMVTFHTVRGFRDLVY